MHRHRLSRFRSTRSPAGRSGWQHQLQKQGGLALLAVACLIYAVLLSFVPAAWTAYRTIPSAMKWRKVHDADLGKIEKHLILVPYLAPFTRGDEPHVKSFLAEQPLVVALHDRFLNKNLWVRKGDILVPADECPLTQRYRTWITYAEENSGLYWSPDASQDPDYGKIETMVRIRDQWVAIKRWQPGSQAAEAAIRVALGSHPNVRIGIYVDPDNWPEVAGMIPKADPKARPQRPKEDPKDGNVQATPEILQAYAQEDEFRLNATSEPLGAPWSFAALATPADLAERRRIIAREHVVGLVLASAIALSMGLGLWLRYRARKQALVEADRMASLTHSLKTPLAILKFRCDSLRLGRLSPDQADEELLKLGEEVDHLTIVIENGLSAIRGGDQAGPRSEVSRQWLEDVAEDLRVAFEAENRPLVLNLCDAVGEASLPSLRAALLTLLENALFHGRGKVTFRSLRTRRRLVLQVADKGEGLERHQLRALGKPFQRIRQGGNEGFAREGQGLGLSLLSQVAEREGWGLSFASAPGKGFVATLELPLSRHGNQPESELVNKGKFTLAFHTTTSHGENPVP